MRPLGDLYTLPHDQLTYAVVRDFILLAEEVNGLTESLTIELKQAIDKRNVIEAVQGLSNAEGGVVLLGVSEKGRGEQRLIGVPTSDHDRLVNQLRSLLPPDALPEVVPVALPDTPDRIIIVLRIDVDEVIHPVVVGGHIAIRMPGQTVSARRQDVVALVQRNMHASQADEYGGARPIIDAANLIPWPEDEKPQLMVRVHGGLRLPGSVLTNPWLSTPAQDSVLEALDDGPLPGQIWAHRLKAAAFEDRAHNWRFVERSSSRLKLHASSSTPMLPPNRPGLRAAAYVSLAGRVLEVVMALGIDAPGTEPSFTPLSLGRLHEILFGLVATQKSVATAVAGALGADFPTLPRPLQAWLQPDQDLRLSEQVDFTHWMGDGARDIPWMSFAPTPIESFAEVDLDAVVRRWLTHLLLDSGATGFEPELAALATPMWPTR